MMFLDISKKPGDPDAVVTEKDIIKENAKLKKVSLHCGDCALFGSDCGAGDVDGNEDCIACEKFRRRAATGNAASIREALESCLNELYEIQGMSELDDLRLAKLRQTVRAALSAPARNCDWFADADEARDAWDAISLREDTDVFGWLFAKTKKEGGLDDSCEHSLQGENGMSDCENETWADIVREMRDAHAVYERYRCGGADCDVVDAHQALASYADRLDAAIKRERASGDRKYILDTLSEIMGVNIRRPHDDLGRQVDGLVYDLMTKIDDGELL